MKKDRLESILIIIMIVLIIIGIIIIFIKKSYPTNSEPEVKPTDPPQEEPIITPDPPEEIKTEKINFVIGMEIYFDPIQNDVCNTYDEKNSYRGVNSGCMRFYGLSNENGYVNMLLDHDLNIHSTCWASRKDYPNEKTIVEVGISDYGDKNYGTFGNNNRGPVTILRLMLEYTKDWQTSVPVIYNYANSYKINYNGHKARMMTLSDTQNICTDQDTKTKEAQCPEWMYKQLGKSESRLYWGYWLADPAKKSDERAFRVTDIGHVKDLYVDNEVGGVRPVLVIPEDKILLKKIDN